MFAYRFVLGILSLTMLLVGYATEIALSQNVTVTLDPASSWDIVRYKTTSGGYDWTVGGAVPHSIGRDDGNNGINSGSTEDIWRQELKFDLTTISDGEIQSVKIKGSFTNYASGTLKARIGSSAGTGGTPQIWANVSSGTEYFTNVTYNTSPLNLSSSAFTNAVIAAASSGQQIFLGVTSLSEGSDDTYATTLLKLEIIYRPKITATVQNSFGGGTIKVDGVNKASGSQLRWLSGSSHTLEATNQPPNNFSQWVNLTTGQPIAGNPITVSPTSNTTYQANFSTNYSVTVRNSFDGGSINVDGPQYNSPATFSWASGTMHTLLATNQDFVDPNGVHYFRVFRQWEIPGGQTSTNNPLSATISSGGEYVSRMEKQFNVTVAPASNIEPGSGVTYKVNGTNVGPLWNGTFVQNISSPITLEATAPFNEWVFLGWSDGLTTNPRQIIPTDHVNLSASYKGHLKTSVPSFSDAKNQRRFVKANNRWMMMYESAGDIWLTESYDGVYWEREERLNILRGVASNPTISNELSGGRFVVSWLEQNGGTTEMHLQTLTLGYYLLSSNGHYYYGWDYSLSASAGERSSNNHRLVSDFYYRNVRSDARPVLFVESALSMVRIQYAYESASSGIYTAKIRLDDNYYTDLGAAAVDGVSSRNVSLNGADKYPVIISYLAAFGYPAKSYIYYLGYGYASGSRVVQYDYWTGTRTLLPTAYDDYTFYSLQGAVNPTSASFALVAEVYKSAGNLGVNFYSKPTYYGSSAPSLSTTYTNMHQPTIMVETASNFGSPIAEINMRSTWEYETWYKANGSASVELLGSEIAGIFAREHVAQGDHATMVTRDNVSPAIIERSTGGGGVVATASVSVVFFSEGSTNSLALLDFQDAQVEAVDSLQSGQILSAVKILNPAAGGQLVRQWTRSRFRCALIF